MKLTKTNLLLLIGSVVCFVAQADMMDRSGGIKIGQRMTLRPYVSMMATYDSNPRNRNSSGGGDVLWSIGPTLTGTYNADNWSLLLSGYYNYRAYTKSKYDNMNRHSYGQTARFNWSDSRGNEKGWSLILGESFNQITMADDIADGYSCDSRQLQFSAALQRRFNEYLHGDVNGNYYWLDYMNNRRNTYGSLFGWQRWTLGAEAGFAPSKWTDFLIAANYQGYDQDNAMRDSAYASRNHIASDSQGWTIQTGIGSYMTERISYRLLAGWSHFEYGGDVDSADGFVYTISGNWKIGETWNTMLLATSYYQPSERQANSKSRIDAISWGLAKSMVRNKLRATLDIRYRRETHEYVYAGSRDYTLDVVTGRLGLDYTLNRFFAIFAYGEYQKSWNDESSDQRKVYRNTPYDYDRWRLTTGIRLSY